MLLRDYVKRLPVGERTVFREQLALAHGKSVALVRKWELDPPPDDWPQEKRNALVRRHPADLSSVKITERLTNNLVTRVDLRPECWIDEEVQSEAEA